MHSGRNCNNNNNNNTITKQIACERTTHTIFYCINVGANVDSVCILGLSHHLGFVILFHVSLLYTIRCVQRHLSHLSYCFSEYFLHFLQPIHNYSIVMHSLFSYSPQYLSSDINVMVKIEGML